MSKRNKDIFGEANILSQPRILKVLKLKLVELTWHCILGLVLKEVGVL